MDNLIGSIKNAVSGKKDDQKSKKTNHSGSFGGFSNNDIELHKRQTNGSTSLKASQISQDALNSLKEYQSIDSNLQFSSNTPISEIIATIYSQGNIQDSFNKLRKYVNDNKGCVDKKFWYMLMDFYQISGEKEKFENVAVSFAKAFNDSPPSWTEPVNKQYVKGSSKLILPPVLSDEDIANFKDFFKASKNEKSSRINLSQCKFDQFNISSIESVYDLFKKLRKFSINVTLMGDNNLINFCKLYINPDKENTSLNSSFIEKENLFWLIYLEILQWKGKNIEFEELAYDYANKFEESPPGWENSAIMVVEQKDDTSDSKLEIKDKILGSDNIEDVINIIKTDLTSNSKSEIELSNVERIELSGINVMTNFFKETFQDKNKEKEVIFKYPNEMILTLLEVTGLTDFIKIIPKKR